MHATIRNYAGNPGLIDELLKHEDEVRRVVREIDGFRAYYLIRTTDGDAVSVSVYDDAAGTEASSRAAREWIGENLPQLGVGAPKVHAGEVVIQA